MQAKWTNTILDETFRNLAANRPDLDEGHLRRTRLLMCRAIRDCLIIGYEPLVQALDLPDPGDRHVLAAAVKARAQVIVTNNVKHFPPAALARWNVEAKRPDDFVLDQIDLDRQVVYACVKQIADSWRRPPGTVFDVLARLERDGLVESVAALS